MGYADEVNLYAGKLSGADLVEAALTHNLEAELADILKMCNGKVKDIVEIYTTRFDYQNAKVVLRFRCKRGFFRESLKLNIAGFK